MMHLSPAEFCRLSGEPLDQAKVLFEIAVCPLPGIYPEDEKTSAELVCPIRVVQAQGSGFVQLGHIFDGSLYTQYAFAGGGAGAYRYHLEWFADEISNYYPSEISILEVGCGDGWLLRQLRCKGFLDVIGIDPSRAASREDATWILSGYFPDDLPAEERVRKRDLVICRHVLEHIETPVPFMKFMAESLKPGGELWIEVPDLESAVDREIWSNFYQLHCNYFSAATLDQMADAAGLRCISGGVVEVFGGSLLRRYELGVPSGLLKPISLIGIDNKIARYKQQLENLASKLPGGTVGYGAAERTAVIMGFAPCLVGTIACLYDGNPLLEGRYLAGTNLKIMNKISMFEQPPPAIILFAISNADEILREWKTMLPGSVMVAIAGGDFLFQPLDAYP